MIDFIARYVFPRPLRRWLLEQDLDAIRLRYAPLWDEDPESVGRYIQKLRQEARAYWRITDV